MDAKSEELKQCVVQFDNNLSLKANKSAMTQQRAELMETFLPKTELKSIEGKIDDVFALVHNQWKQFDTDIESYKELIGCQVSYEIDS